MPLKGFELTPTLIIMLLLCAGGATNGDLVWECVCSWLVLCCIEWACSKIHAHVDILVNVEDKYILVTIFLLLIVSSFDVANCLIRVLVCIIHLPQFSLARKNVILCYLHTKWKQRRIVSAVWFVMVRFCCCCSRFSLFFFVPELLINTFKILNTVNVEIETYNTCCLSLNINCLNAHNEYVCWKQQIELKDKIKRLASIAFPVSNFIFSN